MTEHDKRHGGPYDRGAADSYYRRPFCPHYYVGPSYLSKRIAESSMTADEKEAYKAGFTENEASGDHKEYDNEFAPDFAVNEDTDEC